MFRHPTFLGIVPLKYIEYGVYGDVIITYPKPYSIYLRGTIRLELNLMKLGIIQKPARPMPKKWKGMVNWGRNCLGLVLQQQQESMDDYLRRPQR